MKKKFIASVVALSVAAAGWFFGFSDKSGDKAQQYAEEKIPAKIEAIKKEGMSPNHYISAFVVKVTDGDTFEVTYKEQQEKVRLLCIDTPESVARGVDPQPYSKEASDFTKSMLLNKSVKLYFDKGLRDRYGRLLAYAVLKDDIFYNAVLVKNGYARVELVSPNTSMKDYFNQLQDTAIREKTGLWGLPTDKQPFLIDKNGKYVPRYKE